MRCVPALELHLKLYLHLARGRWQCDSTAYLSSALLFCLSGVMYSHTEGYLKPESNPLYVHTNLSSKGNYSSEKCMDFSSIVMHRVNTKQNVPAGKKAQQMYPWFHVL